MLSLAHRPELHLTLLGLFLNFSHFEQLALNDGDSTSTSLVETLLLVEEVEELESVNRLRYIDGSTLLLASLVVGQLFLCLELSTEHVSLLLDGQVVGLLLVADEGLDLLEFVHISCTIEGVFISHL